MIMVDAEDRKEREEFAHEAATYFALNPKIYTFTLGEVADGVLFAVRWGIGSDCVLVFRIFGDVENYQNIIE